MPKRYSFRFPGTKEMFLNQIKEYPNKDQRFYYIEDSIVELSEKEIRFGLAQGSPSAGYWFLPTIKEVDGKTIFRGVIKYTDPSTSQKGFKRITKKVEEAIAFLFLIPVILLMELFLFLSGIVRKLFKKTKPQEESLEDKLCNLMENHLNCTRQ